MEDRRSDKEYTEGISIEKNKFLKWLDNYWYHYKWVTIIVAFFVVVGIICTVQMCNKEQNDLIVVYAGPVTLSTEEANDISRIFESLAPADFDGDGQKNIAINDFSILSEEQVREQQKQTGEDGKPVFVDNSYNSKQYETYGNYILTGESSIMLLDPWLYQTLVSGDRLMNVSETLGYTPEGAYGAYGVRLGDTKLYENYAVMKLLPEDTVICLMKPYVAGNSSDDEYYEREKAMFGALVGFGKEN